jgi:iron complex outermembrane recepter protein
MNTRILVATTCTAISPLVASLAMVGAAHAQTSSAAGDNVELEEVLVTAQRREEKSRDVPISIANIGAESLEQAGVESLSDVATLTPSLRFDASGSFYQPTIRGVGTAIATSGGGPNVGIYVDGFFSSNAEVSDFQLTKVKSIQVLKGPQGTLFGRNTTGGAILVTTADPSTTTSGEVKASYGSFNAKQLQAYGTLGLNDKIAVDLEGVYSSGDGFIKNINPANRNDKEAKYEDWSVRAGIKFELSESVSMLLRYTHADTDNPSPLEYNAYVDKTGEAGFYRKLPFAAYGTNDSTGKALVHIGVPSPDDPDEVSTPFHTSFVNKSDTLQARINADVGFGDLTSYTQYRKDKSLNLQDLDSSQASIFDISIGVRNKTVSQEFLLTSKPGTALQWTAGINYFQNEDAWDIGASFGGGPFGSFGGSSTKTTSNAGFVDATYELTPKFFVTVGGRYTRDVVSDAFFRTNIAESSYEGADGKPVPLRDAFGNLLVPLQTKIPVDDLTNNRFTPRLVLRYKPTDDSSIYGSFTRGYKAGILNVGGASQVPVKPETINAYEVGYKYDDRRLSADFAAYYYSYKNLQVSSYQSGAAQIRNAAQSRIYGLEGSLRYQISEAFNVNAGAAYTHARYKSFKNAPYYTYCNPAVPLFSGQPFECSAVPTANPAVFLPDAGGLTQVTTDASGYHMQRSPDYTANLGASYKVPFASSQLTLSGNLYYTSKIYFDPSQQFSQDAYTLLGLRAQWLDPSEHYTVAVYGDNVTNKRYRTIVSFNTLGIGNAWSAPATWGLQLGAKF